MSGTRQKIQYSLALVPEGRGEAPGRGHQGTEPPVAKPAPERPACAEQLMEEVCDRGNQDCQEFRAEVGHDRKKGAQRCRDAKTLASPTLFSTSCWLAPIRRRFSTLTGCSTI